MKFLCSIGMHSWRRYNGFMLTVFDKPIGITYLKACRRCGKTGDGWMYL